MFKPDHLPLCQVDPDESTHAPHPHARGDGVEADDDVAIDSDELGSLVPIPDDGPLSYISSSGRLRLFLFAALLASLLAVVLIRDRLSDQSTSEQDQSSNQSFPPANVFYAAGAVNWTAPCQSGDVRCGCVNDAPVRVGEALVTCHMPPPVLLRRYFQPVVDYYPNLLTYRPQVDCIHGRYLVVESFHRDGLGSTLAQYTQLLSFAAQYGLTLVDFPFLTSHKEPSDAQWEFHRMLQTGLYEWHVSREQFDACPADSPVRLRALNLGKYDWQHDVISHEREAWQFNSSLHTRVVDFLSSGSSVGCTVVWKDFTTWRGCEHRVSLMHAIRAHVHPRRTRELVSLFHRDLSPDRGDMIDVGVHVRLGDHVVWDAATNRTLIRFQHRARFFAVGTWSSFIEQLVDALPWSAVRRLRFTIYCEENRPTLQRLERVISMTSKTVYMREVEGTARPAPTFNVEHPVRYILNMTAADSLMAYAESDLVLLSQSDFSYSACMYNVGGLKIGAHFVPRWHGCHNTYLVHIHRRRLGVNDTVDGKGELAEERVVEQSQSLIIPNIERLRQRILKSIERLDTKRSRGPYPFDQQQPTWVREHLPMVTEQVKSDTAMDIPAGREQRADKGEALLRFVAEHVSEESFDESYLELEL